MENVSLNKQADRVLYFDLLRVIATFGVVILHIASQNWYSTDATSCEWHIFNFYDSIVRWTVPIFVMISGGLFLNSKYSTKKIYSKNILRIITAFLFWSILYSAISLIQGASTKSAIVQVLSGHYHMWFLFMIVGLYLISPLVAKIVETKQLTRYFLALSLIFTFVIPQFILIFSTINEPLGNVANSIINKMHFHMTLGYVSYFVCGYYLCKEELTVKIRRIIYILSALGFISTIALTAFISIYKSTAIETLYGNFTVNVLLESIGVFVTLKYCLRKFSISRRAAMFIEKLSKYSFGAYLVHALVIEQLDHFLGLNSLSFHPIVSVPVIGVIVFVISYTISFFMNHLPKINKYIV